MGGRTSRSKGSRVERSVVNNFLQIGIHAERVPLSGAAGGSYTGDVVVLDKFKAEVKARKTGEGFGLLYRWLGDNDLLIVKQDRKELLVALPLSKLKEILDAYAQREEDTTASSW